MLGATFGVAHGALNSVILLHAVTFNALVVVSELTVAAYRLGLAQDSKNVTDQFVNWLRARQLNTGVPMRLRTLALPAMH